MHEKCLTIEVDPNNLLQRMSKILPVSKFRPVRKAYIIKDRSLQSLYIKRYLYLGNVLIPSVNNSLRNYNDYRTNARALRKMQADELQNVASMSSSLNETYLNKITNPDKPYCDLDLINSAVYVQDCDHQLCPDCWRILHTLNHPCILCMNIQHIDTSFEPLESWADLINFGLDIRRGVTPYAQESRPCNNTWVSLITRLSNGFNHLIRGCLKIFKRFI
jgi:hypothetical protein